MHMFMVMTFALDIKCALDHGAVYIAKVIKFYVKAVKSNFDSFVRKQWSIVALAN